MFLVAESNLSEHLTIANSSVLFGCRTGICGTCVVEILSEKNGRLAAPDSEEREILELLSSPQQNARLACQMKVQADLVIRPLNETAWGDARNA